MSDQVPISEACNPRHSPAPLRPQMARFRAASASTVRRLRRLSSCRVGASPKREMDTVIRHSSRERCRLKGSVALRLYGGEIAPELPHPIPVCTADTRAP